MPAAADVRLTPQAERDLAAIWWRGVERWSVGQADAYLADLAATFALIAAHPRMAPHRAGVRGDVRCHPHGAHVVAYRIAARGVEVVRVLPSRSDWIALLAE